MTVNVVNQVAYLRTSRNFPPEIGQLTVEINKSYVDIANNVNNRTISIFPTNQPAINGESWFLTKNQRQEGFRQVYKFTTTADIPIGFKIANVAQFTRNYGQYVDNPQTGSFGLINGTSAAAGIAGQIVFYLFIDGTSTTTDLIKFIVSGTAPVLSSGTIVLEWISQP